MLDKLETELTSIKYFCKVNYYFWDSVISQSIMIWLEFKDEIVLLGFNKLKISFRLFNKLRFWGVYRLSANHDFEVFALWMRKWVSFFSANHCPENSIDHVNIALITNCNDRFHSIWCSSSVICTWKAKLSLNKRR